MPKFEVGDHIRFVGDSGHAARNGATAVVVVHGYVCRDGLIIYNHYDQWLMVEWDEGPLRCSQMHGGYDENSFVLNGGPW